MRIFTLGRNGIPLFFFALLLFSGTYSYGQNCPTVDDTTQEFCYPSTVADLVATENGEAVRWYRSTASTTPIPQNELLENNTYYAGNASGTCTARVAVEVTVDELPAPVSLTGNFWQACLYGETDEDIRTVANLTDLIRTTDAAYIIEVFASGTGGTALAATDILTAGSTYYVAQSDPGGCSSPRLPINYDTVLTTVPTGEAVQIFCNSGDVTPTIADLEASGTNRWYSTATSSPALSPTTPLVHGETYYATSIVNRDNSDEPPCESVERFAVLVSLEVIAENTTQSFCESEGTGNEGGAPTVSDLEPLNSTWYADLQLTTQLAPDQELVHGMTYYLADTDGDCRTTSVTVEITDAPSAGKTTFLNVCTNREPFDLAAEMEGTDLGPADLGGSFSPSLASGTTIFDPAVDTAQRYTYTVTSETGCPSDSAFITVTFVDAPNAGSDISESFCSSELVDNEEALAERFLPYLSGRDINPDFFAVAQSIYAQYQADVAANNFPQTYTATYSVSNDNCTDTAEIEVTVLPSPEAGENNTIYLEDRDDSIIVMLDELNGTPAQGGVWTDSEGNVIDGTFDPLTDTIGVFTYTVTEGTCSDSATLTIQDVQLDCPTVNDTTQELCESVGTGNDGGPPTVADLEPATATWYTSAEATEALPSTTLLVDDESYFAGDAAGECPNRTEVVVNLIPAPNAGKTTTVIVCSNEEPFDMVSRIRPSDVRPADAGGTFSPAFASGTTIFDPAVDVADEYTYRVESTTNCEDDTSEITVVINQAPDAGDNAVVELTEADTDLITLFDELNGTPVTGGTWSNETGVFDPTTDTPGVFTYTVTANGCTATATVTITIEDVTTPEECPEVADTAQDFCESIGTGNDGGPPTVADLEPATATWYASADATEALPITTLLVDGESYFAGNAAGDCANRTEVVVDLVPAPNAGRTTTVTVCSNEEPFDMVSRIRPSDVRPADAGGTFSPAFASGTTIFDPAVDVADEYTYRVESTTNCEDDTSEITVVINQAPDAGDNAVVELTEADTDLITLFDELNGTPVTGGTWSNGTGVFDPTTDTPGVFTYTVTANGCTATATVTITIDDVVEGCPEVTDANQAFCESILSGNNSRLPNVSDLEPANATWYATADATDALALTTVLVNGTTYYAGNASGTCEARIAVTVTLDDSPNAGGTTELTFCENAEAVDLLTVMDPSILGAPDAGGTFSPALASGTTIFDPSVDTAATYTYTVESTNDVCPEDSAVVRITITPAADAGPGGEFEFCSTQGPQDLFAALAEAGVTTEGTFEGLENGIFDPAVNESGEYVYSVEETGGCEGTSTAIYTITVNETPAAPAATDLSFCISENATVADLTENTPGDALLWYTDAELQNLADEADILVEGIYYVTDTNESGCPSAAAQVAVTLTDAPTPTLATGGNVFCDFDEPTIADLEEFISASGTITWYDAMTGGNVISSSTQLQNGTTYYAASTDATSTCESSVRLPVTVDLEDCPVIIPEAFSPNGDNVNDTFEIEHIGSEYPNFTIEIYNRWGNKVFQGNANTPNWDGVSTESRSLGDKVLPVGVYFYIVNYNDGQTAPTQGRLYLSR